MKYRIKEIYVDCPNGGLFVKLKVQVRRWWGWTTIKTYPVFNLFDGTVDITKSDDKHYVYICAEELLDMLNEKI